MSDSILKPNATLHDRAVEQAIQHGKPDLSPIKTLMNPDTCPANLLGWLAWAFSVDVWDSQWSEAIKRETIRNSITVHRLKGTRAAVETSLRSLGMDVAISEWFEHGGAPHTFRLEALAADALAAGHQIDAAFVAEVDLLIRNVKPVRAHYGLQVAEEHSNTDYARTGHLDHGTDRAPQTPTVPAYGIDATAAAVTGLRERARDTVSHTPIERIAA